MSTLNPNYDLPIFKRFKDEISIGVYVKDIYGVTHVDSQTGTLQYDLGTGTGTNGEILFYRFNNNKYEPYTPTGTLIPDDINIGLDTVTSLLNDIIGADSYSLKYTTATELNDGTNNYYSCRVVVYNTKTNAVITTVTEYSSDGHTWTNTVPSGTPTIGWVGKEYIWRSKTLLEGEIFVTTKDMTEIKFTVECGTVNIYNGLDTDDVYQSGYNNHFGDTSQRLREGVVFTVNEGGRLKISWLGNPTVLVESNWDFDVEFDTATGTHPMTSITNAAGLVSYYTSTGAVSATVSSFKRTVNGNMIRIQAMQVVDYGNTSNFSIELIGCIVRNMTGFINTLSFLFDSNNYVEFVGRLETFTSGVAFTDINSMKFNPTFISPLTGSLGFVSNNLTLADYTAMESWAIRQPYFTGGCIMVFGGNPDSPIGTNLEAILNTKNATLYY